MTISRRQVFGGYLSRILFLVGIAIWPTLVQSQKLWVSEGENWVRLQLPQTHQVEELKVFKEGSSKALWGKIIQQGDQHYFQPLIPFQAELKYVVLAKSDTLFRGEVPYALGTSPQVVKIFPQGDTLPANLLKFYIQFSQPMSGHTPYSGIHLLDQAGDTLNRVFLAQNPALWNHDRTRLTIWLDPGRIKRELLLHQKYGPPLMADQAYTLVISSPLQGSNGKQLSQAYQKDFFTKRDDRVRPSLEKVRLDLPAPQSQDPLTLLFGEAMDWGALEDKVWIEYQEQGFSATLQPTTKDTEFTLTPHQAWPEGDYQLHFKESIEDLAGNNLSRLFDQDLTNNPSETPLRLDVSFTLSEAKKRANKD